MGLKKGSDLTNLQDDDEEEDAAGNVHLEAGQHHGH
jgi:hypothetical protein